jgi:hypothetical protein
MRRFISERIRSSNVRPAASKSLRQSKLKLRRLCCEPLEDRRLLSGVTFITHGAQAPGDAPQLPSWVTRMAEEVAARIGDIYGGGAESVAQFRMTVEEVEGAVRVTGWDFHGTFAPAAEDSPTTYDLADSLGGEAVVSLDWSAIATPWEATTQTVAAAISTYLFGDLASLGAALFASPIHLIGHSRGASMVGALAEDFGQAGVWVDQVTYLDTHPIDFPVGADDWGDNGFAVTENVVFADSYWRADLDPFDFDGEAVPGAYNAELNEDLLDNGLGYSSAHSNVHLWYHGTIDTTEGIHDGEVELTATQLAAWYDTAQGMAGPRGETGYYYSRVIGGVRPSAGLATVLGGEGSRAALAWTDAVWPNMLGLEMASTARNFVPGDMLGVQFYHQDYDSQSSARFYLDPDRNPYNDNAILVSSSSGQTLEKTGATPEAQSGVCDLTGVALGDYFVLGAISDEAGHVRYAYAADSITVGTPAPAITDLDVDPGTIDEGGSTTLSCGFTDASLVDVHTVTIDWGDGGSDTFDLTEGERGFARSHQYLDENSAGAPGDPYTITVTVTDADGGSDTKTIAVAVLNVAPIVSVGEDAVINEGDRFSGEVVFADPGADQWTAEVDYGDGSGWQSATLDGKTVKLEYDYDAVVGMYTVSVRVRDNQGGEGVGTFSVTVQNVVPSLWVRGLRVVEEGRELSIADLGIFTDPGFYDPELNAAAFTYAINWADGKPSDRGNADIDVAGGPGRLTWGTFDGAHTYEDDGRYVVVITVEDDLGGVSLERYMTVIVNNVAPRELVVEDLAAVNEGEVAYVRGTFEDQGILDEHTVTVSWGDGTPDTVVVLPLGAREFTISHTYVDDGPNSTVGDSPSEVFVYTVRVTVADGDGGSTGVDKTAEVRNAPPQVTPIGPQEVPEGELFSKVLASFTDAGTLDVHTAMIDWGDGTAAEAGVVDAVDRTVSGSHVYADENKDELGNVIPYTVTVTVTDDDGGVGTGSLEVTVVNVAPELDSIADATLNEGEVFVLGPASFVDKGTLDTHTALVDWGDGTQGEAAVAESPQGPPGDVAGLTGTITASHTYASALRDKEGNVIPYEVTVTIQDDDGGSHSRVFFVTVQNLEPAASAAAGEFRALSLFVGPLTPEQYQALSAGGSARFSGMADGSSSETVRLSSLSFAGSSRPFVGPLKNGAYLASAALPALANGENRAPSVSVVGNLTRPEGLVDFGKIATFLDPDSAGPFRYEIDWGDGTLPVSGDAHLEGTGPPAVGSIDASHLYDDDGFYLVSVTVTDEHGMSTTEQFELTLFNVAPVADANGPYAVEESGTVQLFGSGTDVPGDQPDLVYEWDLDGDGVFGETGEAALRGDENLQNPVFSAHGLAGPRSWTVYLRCRDDGDAVSEIVQATIEIGNAPPVITVSNESVVVAEGATAVNTGTYSDPGGDEVTLAVSAGTIINHGDGTWSWSFATTDGPGDSRLVTITATDSDGAVGTVTFNLVVENVAPAVTVNQGSVTVKEGETAANSGTYSDPGDDTVTLTVSAGTIVDHGDGTWSWSLVTTDGPGESQVVSITATDSDGGASTTTFNLVVENVAPTVTVNQGSVTVKEGETATNTGTYHDPGDDVLTLTVSVGTIVDRGDGTWSWSLQTTDGPDDSAAVTVTISDGDGGTATVTFDLAVRNVAPLVGVALAEVEVLEGQTATNTGTYIEPGNDTVLLTVSAGTIVNHGDGTWSWSFQASDGPDETQVVTVTATDSDGDATTVSFDLVVVNAPPVANADYYVFDGIGSFEVDAAQGVLANDFDPGNDEIYVDAWGEPSVGTLTERRPDGSFVYVGPEGYSGTVTFSYTIRDEDGAFSEHEAVVMIDVGMNAAVTGYVFARNTDSRFQPAELPLPGVFVTLAAIDDTDLRGIVEINTITDDQGRYRFEGLRAGEYQVVALQPAACFVGEVLTKTVTLRANEEGEFGNLYTGWLRPTSVSIGSFLGSTIGTSTTAYGWPYGLREQMAKAEERAGNMDAAYWIRLGEVIQVARRGREVTITGTSRNEAFEFLPSAKGYQVKLGEWSAVYSADTTSRVRVRSGGGYDTAVLHDSVFDDVLRAEFDSVSLANIEFACELRDFSFVQARSEAGGVNTKSIAKSVDFVLQTLGKWN